MKNYEKFSAREHSEIKIYLGSMVVVFMTDLGSPNGATGDEIAEQVTAVLLERSMAAAKRAGVQQLVDEQKDRLQDKAREKLDDKLKDLLKKRDG